VKGALDDIFHRIDRTESPRRLWSLMVRYFRARGFGSLLYILLDHKRPGYPLAVFGNGMPPGLKETYVALGGGRHDPMVRVAMATGSPQIRSKIVERFRLTHDEGEHRAVMQGLGLGETLLFPLFGPARHDAAFGLACPERESVIPSANLVALHMAGQAAHLRLLALRPDLMGHGQILTAREIEILRWVAQGKSNSVIAEILGLAPGTVDTYLRRVFDKLDVADRTTAAVKGLSLGLIRA
jgi:DNA-binding CsgD family transcriptional regulator